jgi:hypothetical protein
VVVRPAGDPAGRTAEALAIYEQVVVDSERLLGREHPETLARRRQLEQWRNE